MSNTLKVVGLLVFLFGVLVIGSIGAIVTQERMGMGAFTKSTLPKTNLEARNTAPQN